MQGRYKTPIPILTSGCSSFRKRGHGNRFQIEFKNSENRFEIKNGKIGHGSKKLESKCSVAFGFKYRACVLSPATGISLAEAGDWLKKGGDTMI